MQRETLYNLYRKTYFNCVQTSKYNTIVSKWLQKLVAHSFAFFENKKNIIEISLTM